MIKRGFLLLSLFGLLLSCDMKKSSISGSVVSKSTGKGLEGALVNFVQCKTNGENCTELIIGQMFTSADGTFIISEKMGSKSKTTWITVFKDGRKLAQKDHVGLNDKNILIEVP